MNQIFQRINNLSVEHQMKIAALLFLQFIASVCISQSLDRQLYVKYFKSLYLYEPAAIRKQKIRVLEIQFSEYRMDTITFSALKERALFRKDGRPISHIVYTDFHRDSTLYNYRYDSLGNLIEFKKWKPKNRWEKNDRVEQHLFFKYAQNHLEQVFSFYMNSDMNSEMMLRCDSLKYESDQEHIIIYTGNVKGFKIGLTKELRFIYPLNTQATLVLTSPVNKALAPPVDDEVGWDEQCTYDSQNLQLIQKITGKKCIERKIKEAAQVINFGEKDSLDLENLERVAVMNYVMNNSVALIIDTLHHEFIVKSDLLSIQPTSMEDRVSRTLSYDYYSYAMRLQRTESIHESSRGSREHVVTSSTVNYSYNEFGFVQQKREAHVGNYNLGGNQTFVLFEERMTLIPWE